MGRLFQEVSNQVRIEKVWFEDRTILVQLNDGKIISRSIDLFPHLRKGTMQQWEKFELWGEGKWIHWEELDEDLSVEGFL